MHAVAAAEPAQGPSLTALDRLARRCHRLACVVEAGSRRRDVRELRSEILLLLLSIRCPVGTTPARPEYVPGAVVRLGAGGIQRAWWGYFGRVAPVLRTIRQHLGDLELLGVLVRSPGDLIPGRLDPRHPERRPRYADTFHLLEREEDAEWWRDVGWPRFEDHRDAEWNPAAWRKWFGRWREESRRARSEPCLEFEPAPLPAQEEIRVDGIERAARADNPLEALALLRANGVHVHGTATFRLSQEPDRMRAAVQLLARALRRGDRVRNAAAWLVRAFYHAPEVRGAPPPWPRRNRP